MSQKLKIAGLVAVIAVAGLFVVLHLLPNEEGAPDWDWACVECEHTFVAEKQMLPRECPECEGEAVRSYLYYDALEERVIELYRERPDPGAEPELQYEPSHQLVQPPGGEWQRRDDRFEYDHGIPIPVERPEDLHPAPPGSEYRD